MKIKRLYQPEDFTVNRLYMFMNYNTLCKGYCKCITEKDVTFSYNGNDTTLRYKEWNGKQIYFAEYNPEVIRKYEKLVEYHKQEIKDLLESNIYKRDKDVVVNEKEKKNNAMKIILKNCRNFVITIFITLFLMISLNLLFDLVDKIRSIN